MIGQLRVWVSADKWTINTTIVEIQKIKKAWDDVEKSLSNSADKWMKKLKKEAETTLNTIAKLNDKIWNLKSNLDTEVIWWKRFKELQKEIFKTEKALEKATWWSKSFFSSLSWIWWAVWWIIALSQAKDTADIFSSMQNSLRLVAEWKELDILQQKILTTANNARVPVDALTKSFVRFDLVNKQLGWTQDETLKIMDSLSKWLSMTWATAEETWSVMLQLSQAFGSGVLQWDEFRSISEAMPMLLDILAKKLGVTRWELKQYASDWKITSKILKESLIEANDQITESFEKSSVTIWQKLTQIRNDFIVKFWEIDKNVWFTDKIISSLEFIRNTFLSFFQEFPKISLWIWGALLWLTSLSAAILVLWPAVSGLISLFWFLTTAISWTTLWVVWLRTALTFLTWPIGLIIGWLTALWWLAYTFREELWFVSKWVDEVSESQKKLNEITDKQKESLEKLKKEQEELNKKYNEWTIWNKEYKESIEKNKIALEKLAISQIEVQKWLDIINNQQLNYKQKIEQLNLLKLNDSEYQKLIWVIKGLNAEKLKSILLDQKILQSKIAWLKEPTVELKKASAELNQVLNQTLTTWEGGLVWNQNKPNLAIKDWKFILKITEDQKIAENEYSKQVKINNEQNTEEVKKYKEELQKLQDEEKKLIDISREAEDIVKKPTWWNTPPITATWWSWKKEKKEKEKTPEQIAKDEQSLAIERLETEKKLAIYKASIAVWSEEEKARKILEINKKYDEKLKALKWDTFKNEVDKAKETLDNIKKKRQENLDDAKKVYNEMSDNIDKYINKAKSNIKDFDKAIDETQKKIKGLNEEIKSINEDLWNRFVEIWNKSKDLNDELKKLKNDWVNIWLAESIWLDSLKLVWTWEIWWNKVEDLIKILEIQKELNNLKNEENLIKQKVDSWVLTEAQRVANLSPAEKYLEKIKTIEDEKLLEEKKLLNLEANKQNEIILLENFTKSKENLEDRFEKYKQDIEAKITWVIESENKKRLDSLTNYVNNWVLQLQRLAEIKSSMWLDYLNNNIENSKLFAEGWYTGNGWKYETAWIVHKWEYVIPQHVLNNLPNLVPILEKLRVGWVTWWNQTFNNQKSISVWGVTVQNKVDLESFFDKMKWKL